MTVNRTAYTVFGLTLVIEGNPADGKAYFRPRGRETFDKVTITDVTDAGFTASVDGHDIPLPALYIERGLSWDGWHYMRQPEPFTEEIILTEPSDAPRNTLRFVRDTRTGETLCVRVSDDHDNPRYRAYVGRTAPDNGSLRLITGANISFNRGDGSVYITSPSGVINTATEWVDLGPDGYDFNEADKELTFARKV